MGNTNRFLPTLIKAGFEKNLDAVEQLALNIIRATKKDDPELSKEIVDILSIYKSGSSYLRGFSKNSIPKDEESLNSLLKVESWDNFQSKIYLSTKHEMIITDFLKGRSSSDKLLEFGLKPINSIILYGEPGVGKTHLAKYISKMTELPLLTLDLSNSISSFLGRTGKNLREVLDFAKKNPSILFLDEFDSIAKRRDDSSDIGELKRIVNVLLKELEDWPSECILIAATNHPEILDPAIWRRFDIKIEIDKPDKDTRLQLWEHYLDRGVVEISLDFIEYLSSSFEGFTPAEIQQISKKSLQKQVVSGGNIKVNVLNTILTSFPQIEKNQKKDMIREIKSQLGSQITQRELADISGISLSSVNRYINS